MSHAAADIETRLLLEAVYARYSHDFRDYSGASLKRRVQQLYMRADAFACNNRDNEREALECGVPHDRVHYLPNAVNTERYRPAAEGEKAQVRAEHGWRADAELCMYVGRLSAEKGVLELLQAWREIGGTNRVLVLVGPDMPGPLDAGPAARRFVADHGLRIA